MFSRIRLAMFLRRFPAVISPARRAFSSKIYEEIDPLTMNIHELNQEMQSIFGEEPSSDAFSGPSKITIVKLTVGTTRRAMTWSGPVFEKI